jgi:high-affinity K+ transport system ATPase subunit B
VVLQLIVMTDLSSFSKNDFSSTAWINSLVDEVPEGESLESFLTSIGMKLHITAQDYSEQLEAAMVESMTTMPRMVADIARLEDQLHSVQHEMRSISDHLQSVDKKSVAGIEELSRLDHLKANMEKCKSTLEEHARWSQLEREAKQLLESGGILAETADK